MLFAIHGGMEYVFKKKIKKLHAVDRVLYDFVNLNQMEMQVLMRLIMVCIIACMIIALMASADLSS